MCATSHSQALKDAMNGQPLPMQTQTANFPNSTGAGGFTQPRTGRRRFEFFGEQTNNSQNPSVKPQRQQRNEGDFPGHGDDVDNDPDDDDEGYGPYDHPYAT
eukprot:4814138-Amphidinium_carterae.1